MTARCRTFLDLCHFTPCFYDEPHSCNGYLGCEPAHGDWSFTGRGIGHKSSDGAIASICHNGHRDLTAKVGDELTRERKQAAWLRAHFKTLDFFLAHGWLTVNTKKARQEGTICE